jgi:hypothetical protein
VAVESRVLELSDGLSVQCAGQERDERTAAKREAAGKRVAVKLTSGLVGLRVKDVRVGGAQRGSSSYSFGRT